jgi:multicomponent Na+:H+ antiporter subunit A
MLPIFFALPAGAGIAALFLPKALQERLGWLSATVTASLFGLALAYLPRIADGGFVHFSYDWVNDAGVNFSFLLDGYSMFFTLLVAGMGTLIFFYSQEYMSRHPHRLKFYAWMLAFTGSMLGLVTSANLIVLYVFWEATTICSFFLIGLSDKEEQSRASAVQALVITSLGGLAMLAGFLLIYVAVGTFELPEIWARADAIRDSALAVPIAVLVGLGVVTKSAMVPFHIWLPSAMVAPTPVSAYLHSATMVKAGVFLAARMTPVFHGMAEWEGMLVGMGLVTLVVGGVLALRQTDLKALLAYSTVSQLGMMMALYGLGTELAAAAATLHLMSHATFKGAMFLIAGAVEHGTGTRNLERLGGLASAMPALATLATVAALSSGGIPPLNGFVSKEAMLGASLETEGWREWGVTATVVVGSAFTLAYSLRFLMGTFFGQARDADVHPHKPSMGLLAPIGVLAAAMVALGVYPALTERMLMSPAVAAVTQQLVHVELGLWHGVTRPLMLSVAAIAAGVSIYMVTDALNEMLSPVAARRTFERAYTGAVGWVERGLPRVFWRLQNGDLRTYVVVIVLFVIGLTALAATRVASIPLSDLFEGAELGVLDYALASLLVVGGAAMIFRRGRLESVINLGFVGMLVVSVFALYSAPDLALTQVLVELVMVLLFVLAFRKMLRVFHVSKKATTLAIQAMISAAFGAFVSLILLAVLATPQHPSIAPYFLEQAPTEGHSKNVVNSILIDFRGYDTLGEITVIALAALAAFAIVRAIKERG